MTNHCTHEVWRQRGGFEPERVEHMRPVTLDGAHEAAARMNAETQRFSRPEGMQTRYFVKPVDAPATRPATARPWHIGPINREEVPA